VKVSPYFVAITTFFVTALVVANVLAVKLVEIGDRVFPAGLVVFPLSYLLGDVLTEVYGFRAARAVIWLGFACNLLAIAAIQIAIKLPPASFYTGQKAYAETLGTTWRIFLASLAAYVVGELANSAVLARMKIATRGRYLWTRTLGSTFVGEGLDSFIFVTIAFAGRAPLLDPILTTWAIKVVWEAAATPLTYYLVNTLKRQERIDVYEDPFRVSRLAR
jgi:uncharacterized integral membrane protein (TIGR00697 family)